MNIHFSKAKLKPPRLLEGMIRRAALIDLLEEAASHPLIIVSAPAGFGKSTLLSQWYVSRVDQKEKSAWLNLDESDSDPRQFLAQSIFSLDSAGVDVGDLLIAAQEGLIGMSVELILRRLMDTILTASSPMLLVLDDYHRAQSQVVDRLILDIFRQGEGKIILSLSSRDKPGVDLSSVLVTGNAAEISAAELRFSDTEVRSAVGVELNEESFNELRTKVEGWPVAVHLAKIMLRDDKDYSLSISQLHGHTGHLATYLTGQVIDRLRPALQEFLLKTSILDTFDADLADAVCDHESSRQLIRELEPLGALAIPLDDAWTTFRYHHLFAECLQDLLMQRFEDEHEELHLRACAWLGEQGAYTEAVKHGMAVKRYDVCADIVAKAGGWELVLFGGIGYLSGLLRHFPEDVLKIYPRLQFAKSYLAMKDGLIPEARARFDSAKSSLNFNGTDSAVDRDYINLRILVEAYEDNGLVDPENGFIHEAMERIDANDSITRGVIQCNLALRCTAFGEFQFAFDHAESAARSMREGRSVLGLNYCYLHLGMIAFYTGDYRVALANFGRAIEMAEDNFGADSGLKYISTVCLCAVRYWRGELDDESAEYLLKAMEYVYESDGWFEIFAIGLDALFHRFIQARRYDDALAVVERMQVTASERGIERLSVLCSAFRLMHLTQANNLSLAALEYERLLEAMVRRKNPSLGATWLTRFFSTHACAKYLCAVNVHEALRYARQSREIVSSIDANFFLLRADIMTAIVKDADKRRDEAVKVLIPALKTAAREELQEPFLTRAVERLLFSARGQIRGCTEDILLSNFLSNLLDKHCKGDGLFSNREMQVLQELANGKSNKEIARVLDRTENTVKFHVKNIFAKLNVTRRVQAVTAAKSLNLVE